MVLFLPAFFAFTGMRTQLGLLVVVDRLGRCAAHHRGRDARKGRRLRDRRAAQRHGQPGLDGARDPTASIGDAAAPRGAFGRHTTSHRIHGHHAGWGPGRSLTSVLALIAHLDRARFEPVLVLFEPKQIPSSRHISFACTCCRPCGCPPHHPVSRDVRASSPGAVHRWRVIGCAPQVIRVLRNEQPAIVYMSTGLMPGLPVLTAEPGAGFQSSATSWASDGSASRGGSCHDGSTR